MNRLTTTGSCPPFQRFNLLQLTGSRELCGYKPTVAANQEGVINGETGYRVFFCGGFGFIAFLGVKRLFFGAVEVARWSRQ